MSNSQHAVLQQQQQQQQQQQHLFCQIKYKLKISTAKEFKGGLPEEHTLHQCWPHILLATLNNTNTE